MKKEKGCKSLFFTMSLLISSWSLNIIRWRVVTGVFLHDGKACFAADTAALNSSFVVNGTWETTSCVAWPKDEPWKSMRHSSHKLSCVFEQQSVSKQVLLRKMKNMKKQSYSEIKKKKVKRLPDLEHQLLQLLVIQWICLLSAEEPSDTIIRIQWFSSVKVLI